MDSGPSKDNSVEQPTPETLHERTGTGSAGSEDAAETKTSTAPEAGKKTRRATYRPSHRATFIGLAVVAAFLVVNGVVITFVLRSQSKPDSTPQGQVTVSKDVLERIGVNQGTVGDSGIVLTIGPNTEFKGKVTVGGDIAIAGQLKLNGKFSAADAGFTQLQAGKTSINTLTVSGDSTFNNLSVLKELSVTGTTLLQGPVTVSQLFTINNSANIAGNLSVGATVSAASVVARSLTTTSTLTISGHVITAGNAPTLTGGVGLGSNGTISISGNDAAGTVAVNVGVGMSSGGIIANVTFHNAYAQTPHVVVTPIGNLKTTYYITRSNTGFSIGVDGPIVNPGGYAFDFIVEQ
jgi:hypothetical protein